MSEKKLNLRIVTPIGIKVDEQVDMVIMRCITGDLGVLPGHEPYSAVLDYGVLRIIDDETERRMAMFGGLAEVKDDVLTIVTKEAEWPEDIDRAYAELEHEQATQRLKEKTSVLQMQEDQVIVRRSLVRIEVSSYPIVNNRAGAKSV